LLCLVALMTTPFSSVSGAAMVDLARNGPVTAR
jgi:hypothetical protein